MTTQLIDMEQIQSFSPTIYKKALEIYIGDHEAFLTNAQPNLKKEDQLRGYHKAKSGAYLLGFTHVATCIELCEEEPDNNARKEELKQRFTDSIKAIQSLSFDE